MGALLSLQLISPGADIAFDPPILLENEDGTAGSACGDLDQDGRIEFVTQEHFAIYDFDQGAINTYRPLPDIIGRLDRFGGDIEIGDIDGDTWPDIILTDTSNSGDTGELIWFENPDGDLAGNWVEHSVSVWDGIDPGNQITHAEEEVGDINGDGLLDIAVRDIRHGFWIHLQNPLGGWHPRVFVATNPREGLELWDPDGDGDLDVLLNGVWFETPPDPLTETFTQHAIIGMENWYPAGSSNAEINDYACKVIAADFNLDGKQDVLISNAEELSGLSETKPHGIAVYLQPGDIINDPWREMIVEPLNFSWHTLQVRDMNDDGFMDVIGAVSLVGVDTAPAESNIWLNDGTSNFTKNPIATDFGYQGEIGDSDGDGDQDLLLPETFSSGEVRLYENISTILPDTNFSNYMGSFGLTGPDADADFDFDQDNLDNIIEFVLGTDPSISTPPGDRPQLTMTPNGSTFTFRRLDDSIIYKPEVEYSVDLSDFLPAEDGVDGVSTVVTDEGFGSSIDRVETALPDTLSQGGKLFARLHVEPLSVAKSNYWSFMTGYGLSLNDATPGFDPDQDGLSNRAEFILGTDPTLITSISDLPSQSEVEGGRLVIYRRSDASIPAYPVIGYTTDFINYQFAINGVDGVTIDVTDDGFAPGVDRVEVFLPDSLKQNNQLFSAIMLGTDIN